jgi:thioredoxin reductase
MDGKFHQFVVIGAGPYGLAAANRLRTEGYDVAVFGEAMSFWDEHMPAGMFLRSSWDASNIGALHGPLTIDAYQDAIGKKIQRPIPIADFVAYGRWFQQQALPDLDARRVMRISQEAHGFALTLNDGEVVRAGRVIVATGLNRFPNRPRVFAGLMPTVVSHAIEHDDLSVFNGQRVAVIGSGQSALESSALLHENGAMVEIIARAPAIRWLARSAKLHSLPKQMQHLMYSPTDVGPPGLSWLVAWPEIFRRLPKSWQPPLAYRAIRPAGSGWLVPRLRDVPITTGASVINASPNGKGLHLKLSDGGDRTVDHVFLSTGYSIDVCGYEFLDPAIRNSIQEQGGYPTLHGGFESSVPGLHFIGAAAALSYSPIMRFVSGTWFTSDHLAHQLKNRVGAGR